MHMLLATSSRRSFLYGHEVWVQPPQLFMQVVVKEQKNCPRLRQYVGFMATHVCSVLLPTTKSLHPEPQSLLQRRVLGIGQ